MCSVQSLSHVQLCDPMDCSPRLPGSSVYGILQARILEWVAIPFSRGSFQPRDQTQVSSVADRFFTVWATREGPIPLHPFASLCNYFAIYFYLFIFLRWLVPVWGKYYTVRYHCKCLEICSGWSFHQESKQRLQTRAPVHLHFGEPHVEH